MGTSSVLGAGEKESVRGGEGWAGKGREYKVGRLHLLEERKWLCGIFTPSRLGLSS